MTYEEGDEGRGTKLRARLLNEYLSNQIFNYSKQYTKKMWLSQKG